MRTGAVIIGANYGDEGKGLMTDYLASNNPTDSLVVRFNGGAQAGHTVVLPDGRRHIFSHIGSGAFAGCPTFLSRFFIVNPLLFMREYKQLRALGLVPVLTVDAEAFVTTPYDMFINQLVESRRGKGRHGSCGAGINETVVRCLRSDSISTVTGDTTNASQFLVRLSEIERNWFPARLREHGIDPESLEVRSFLESSGQIRAAFMRDVDDFLAVSTVSCRYPEAERVIFEGAQGLMLDQGRIDLWPHLTRSSTGLANVVYLAPRFGLDALRVTYVSRTYITRHGAGPLPGENDWSFADGTNVRNEFQGKLRFAPLDWHMMRRSIALDLAQARFSFPGIDATLALTCADQLDVPSVVRVGIPLSHVSYGPTRLDVKTICRV
jgi:adenylosuccinate synthase